MQRIYAIRLRIPVIDLSVRVLLPFHLGPSGREISDTLQDLLGAPSHSRIRGRSLHRDIRALSPSRGRHRVPIRIIEHKLLIHLQHGLNSPLEVVLVDLHNQGDINNPDLQDCRLRPVDLAILVVAWVTL